MMGPRLYRAVQISAAAGAMAALATGPPLAQGGAPRTTRSSPQPATSSSTTAAAEELVVRALPRPGLRYAGLLGVSCPSPSFCMAVGSFGSGSSMGSFFERFNGRSWRRIEAQRGVNWLAVSCLSDSFCLTVGTAGRGTRILSDRWNGRSWSGTRAFSPPVSAPEPGANPGEGLQSLSCAARNDCWAVGYAYGRTLVEHWNGRSFTRSSAPVRNGNLISVSCSAARDCWAVNAGPDPPAALQRARMADRSPPRKLHRAAILRPGGVVSGARRLLDRRLQQRHRQPARRA